MLMQTLRSNIGLALAAVVLVCGLAARPGLAEEAASTAHGDGQASSPSGESSGTRAPAGADGGGGAGGTRLDGHAPHGDDGKSRDGVSPGSNETVKDVQPPTPAGKDAGAIDTSIAPSRRLDHKPGKTGEGKTTIQPAPQNLRRRTLSASPTPNRPIRNAIGVPVPARQSVERYDSTHPGAPAVPRASPGGTAVPGSVGSRFTRTEGAIAHRTPNQNPIVTPVAPNRGAISGTGLIRRNVGPSQIGGPKASVAGVNGTTIRPKH
jgi:hypothetical protein